MCKRYVKYEAADKRSAARRARQCLCQAEDIPENQAEDNHVFQPHFPDCQREDKRRQRPHFHCDGVTGHAKDHAEHHDQCKYNGFKFCFWHDKALLVKNERKKRHQIQFQPSDISRNDI